jgi:plastocyanin
MRQSQWGIAAVVAFFALVVAACPADDPVVGTPEDGDRVVAIRGSSFQPATLEVDAGTTVTFENEDAVQHTVTAGSPGGETGDFDESLAQGEMADVTFDEPGTHPYFCRIHPNMTGEIQVRG